MRRSRRNRGFTLIELLVVIAIIAIMAAILFPVFLKAKRTAQINVCLNNLKEWGNAITMYVDDNSGRYPYAGAALHYPHARATGGSQTCYLAVRRYVSGNKDIRWCPVAKALISKQYQALMGWSYWWYCPHDNNPWVQAYPQSALCGFTTADVTRPTRKPLVAEVACVHEPGGEASPTGPLYPLNFVYCDGHAKQLMLTYRSRCLISYTFRNGVVPDKLKPPMGNE